MLNGLLRATFIVLIGLALFLSYAAVVHEERLQRCEGAIEILKADNCRCQYYLKGRDQEGKPFLLGGFDSRFMAEQYMEVEKGYGTDSLTILQDCDECER